MPRYALDHMTATSYQLRTTLCRLTALGFLLLRGNLAYQGWTALEVEMLQHHISYVWLPLVKQYLRELYHPDEASRQARVLKVHIILVHATERLLSHGPPQVCNESLVVFIMCICPKTASTSLPLDNWLLLMDRLPRSSTSGSG